jgi:threonine/homoserine/homoserine lactone efflux protein
MTSLNFDHVAMSAAALLLAYLPVLLMPGPNFLVVMQASVSTSVRSALVAALGVACGSACAAALAFTGVGLVWSGETLAQASHIVFVLLLLKLGADALRRGLNPQPHRRGNDLACARRNFRVGFLTAVLNPVTFAFFAGAYGRGSCGGAGCTSFFVGLIFTTVLSWFFAVGVAFAQPAVRLLYERMRSRVEIGLAACLIAAGVAALMRLM